MNLGLALVIRGRKKSKQQIWECERQCRGCRWGRGGGGRHLFYQHPCLAPCRQKAQQTFFPSVPVMREPAWLASFGGDRNIGW